MNVELDLLESNYITRQLQEHIEKKQDQHLAKIKNDIILSSSRKIENDTTGLLLDEAIQSKHQRVTDYLEKLSISSLSDTIKHMEHQRLTSIPNKRKVLGEKVARYVKTILELLDVTWSIIEEFKYKMEKDKNIQLDEYYTALVDTLLIRVKTLHLTVLVATYDDPEFIKALQSLKNLFELKCMDAESALLYTTQRLKEYSDIGPEYKTLCAAYTSLLNKIQATKDDIQKIKNN